MPNINNRVKLWRGTRANYNALGTWDYWTEYNVKETNGTWTKYYGTKEVVGDSGELAPVEGILSPAEFGSLDASAKTQGSRWLVGSGDRYYVVEFGPNTSVEATRIEPLGHYSVRVKDHGLRAYEIVDGELTTYDLLFATGETPSTSQTLNSVLFDEEDGVVSGSIVVDEELDDESTNPLSNRAITKVIIEDEKVIAEALNDLNSRISSVADADISGTGVISTQGNLSSGVTISHNQATVTESSSAVTIADGGSFSAVSKVGEDAYGHVTGITATTFTIPSSQTNVSATGDSYVSASVANGSAITISTNSTTALTDNQASGTVADSKAIVDYIKEKLGAIKNVTTIGSVAVPTSASTFNIVSGNTLISITTAADSNDGITTTITPVTATTTSSTVGLVTNEEVKRYVEDLLTSVMHFKGPTGSLPASAETGDVYIVATSFTVNGETAEVGDYIVYYEPEGGAGQWTVIEKNDTGVVTSTGLTANAMVLASGPNSLVSAGTVGSATRPFYLDNGVPTPITEAVSGTSELVYGSAVTLATIEGINIDAELPELDTELDTGSTNAVQNSAITTALYEVEEAVAAALNDLNDRKADKSYVDEAISAHTVDVTDYGATVPVNSSSATTIATVGEEDITAKVSMATITIAGAGQNASEVEFDGTTDIEILVLDCGEY